MEKNHSNNIKWFFKRIVFCWFLFGALMPNSLKWQQTSWLPEKINTELLLPKEIKMKLYNSLEYPFWTLDLDMWQIKIPEKTILEYMWTQIPSISLLDLLSSNMSPKMNFPLMWPINMSDNFFEFFEDIHKKEKITYKLIEIIYKYTDWTKIKKREIEKMFDEYIANELGPFLQEIKNQNPQNYQLIITNLTFFKSMIESWIENFESLKDNIWIPAIIPWINKDYELIEYDYYTLEKIEDLQTRWYIPISTELFFPIVTIDPNNSEYFILFSIIKKSINENNPDYLKKALFLVNILMEQI